MFLKRILKLKKSRSRERWKLEQILAAGCIFFLEWFFAKYGLFFNVNIVLVHPAPI
jgi:hypothetical protein